MAHEYECVSFFRPVEVNEAWPTLTRTISIIHYRTKRCVYLKESAWCSEVGRILAYVVDCAAFSVTHRYTFRATRGNFHLSNVRLRCIFFSSRTKPNSKQPTANRVYTMVECVCNFMCIFSLDVFLFFIAPSLSLQQVADSLHIPLPYVCISLFREQGSAHRMSV